MDDKAPNGLGTIGGVSDQQLRWSQWWLDNKENVRKIALGLFIGLDAILVGYGFWGFIDWLALGGIREEQAMRQMTSADYGRFSGIALEELQIGAPVFLTGGANKVDLLTTVENRNRRFWAELEYRFTVDGNPLPLRRAFVLPGQAKYLAELGAPAGGSIEMKVEKRVWHRVDLSGTTDPEAFAADHLNIYPANPVYTPSDPLATTPSSSAKFTLVNDTAFSYRDIGVLVLLYRGDAVVGVNRVSLDALDAGKRQPMEIFWYQILPQVSKVDVVPDINIYDPNAYAGARSR